MKKSPRLMMFGLSLLLFSATSQARADGSIVCASAVLGAAPSIAVNMSPADQETGTVDDLHLQKGTIKRLPARSSALMEFEFDSGIVHLTSRNGLSDKRIHGILEVNLLDPERSQLKAQTLSRVCEGINVFGHCSGNWVILESDAQPVVSTMSCTVK